MGASLGVLASLMQSMAEANNIRPWDEAQRSMNQADTGLLQLQEMKRQQATAQRTREFLQQHPELVLGQGGGSVLGSLQQPPAGPPGVAPTAQTQVMPGQPTGAPQQVPGGQDPSRFAGVSPQGGGPIPPNVMGQVMPQVTPPQGPPGTPTLATLGQPQGQQQALQNRFLLDLARTSPDAAMQVQQLMQGQQDAALKRDEQRLDMGVKVLEYVGRQAQGVTDQAGLDAMRQDLGRSGLHQYAAQLPQMYNKEAMAPFITRAVSAKDNALLRLETWKNQIEMQKAGLQGEPAAMVSELRTMGVNPLQATTEQRQQAQKNIQQREVEQKEKEGLASAQARTEGEKQARLDKTVSEAFGERTTKIYDTQTGDPVDSRMRVKAYEAMPQGRARELSTNLSEQMENVRTSVPIIAQLQGHIDKLYGPGGVLERMTPDERSIFASWTNSTGATALGAQFMQKYPELTTAQAFIDSNASGLARALAGEKGALAEGDVERAKAMLPNLKTALSVWPPSQLGAKLPDTRAVALGHMNNIVDMINGRVRTILGNEQFTHPKLHRYETAQEVQAAGGDPKTQPTLPLPARPIPPQVGPNPNLKPLPPTFGPGDPTQQLRPRPPAPPVTPRASSTGKEYERLMTPPTPGKQPQAAPAPVPRPTPPTATSTPAQDEAYRQSQGQGRPPAPAARPTPGRQSQAPAGTRLAGAPKYMEPRDVVEAMAQTGRSRAEVEKAARSRGFIVYGSKLPLPEVTMVG